MASSSADEVVEPKRGPPNLVRKARGTASGSSDGTAIVMKAVSKSIAGVTFSKAALGPTSPSTPPPKAVVPARAVHGATVELVDDAADDAARFEPSDDGDEIFMEWVTKTRDGVEVHVHMVQCIECGVMFEASEVEARKRDFLCNPCLQFRRTRKIWRRCSGDMPVKIRRAVRRQLAAIQDMLENELEATGQPTTMLQATDHGSVEAI